jgi:hypothetical protein
MKHIATAGCVDDLYVKRWHIEGLIGSGSIHHKASAPAARHHGHGAAWAQQAHSVCRVFTTRQVARKLVRKDGVIDKRIEFAKVRRFITLQITDNRDTRFARDTRRARVTPRAHVIDK